MTRAGDREGKFIAVANMKGGVGKTTAVVSLAETLAASDLSRKVLVIDLDPQASASVAIAGDEELSALITARQTFEAFLDDRLVQGSRHGTIIDKVHDAICATWHQNQQLAVSLLPCGPRLRLVERLIVYALGRSRADPGTIDLKLRSFFEKEVLTLSASYDYILFDCAPGVSPVTEAAIRLSDLVIVPSIPDRMSVFGFNALCEEFWGQQPLPKSRPHLLVTRMNNGIRQHREVLQELLAGAEEEDAIYDMLDAQIPTSAALVQALMMGGYPTFHQKYTTAVVNGILLPLVDDVRKRLR